MFKKIVFALIISFCFLLLPRVEFKVKAENNHSEIVMECNSRRVLYENDADKKLPMASTTKILTALIIIEDCDLNAVFQIPKSACGIEGSSLYLKEGEKIKISDLLHGLMLRSGNDCAVALALYHSKSIENFACVMNERAKKIGAINSNFTNPHGLHDDEHYTTARDLCEISCYAMQNPIFKKIVSTQKIVIADSGAGYDRLLVNKNKFLYNFDGANGVKTGYTKVAGRCLVAGAERNGMQLVSVVLNCGPMYERSAEILTKSFSQYSYEKIYDCEEIMLSTEVKNKKVCVETQKDFYYPIKKDEKHEIKIKYNLPKNVKLPIKKGEVVGEMQIYLKNQLLFSQKIVSIENKEKNFIDILRDIAKGGKKTSA